MGGVGVLRSELPLTLPPLPLLPLIPEVPLLPEPLMSDVPVGPPRLPLAPGLALPMPEEVAPPPEARLMAIESLQQIDRVLDGLPPKVREAFLLAHLFELSYAEIAERLGASTSSVKQYLTRANRECMFALAY